MAKNKQAMTEKTMTEAEAAEQLLYETFNLIGRAEFNLWRCDEPKCRSCAANKKAIHVLRQNAELLAALTSVDHGITHPVTMDKGEFDDLTDLMNLDAAKVFPELDPHNVEVF